MNIESALDIIHKNLSINSGGVELEAMLFIRKELLGDSKNSTPSVIQQLKSAISLRRNFTMYRLLENGDVLKGGDEWLNLVTGKWNKIIKETAGCVMPYAKIMSPHRRKIFQEKAESLKTSTNKQSESLLCPKCPKCGSEVNITLTINNTRAECECGHVWKQ